TTCSQEIRDTVRALTQGFGIHRPTASAAISEMLCEAHPLKLTAQEREQEQDLYWQPKSQAACWRLASSTHRRRPGWATRPAKETRHDRMTQAEFKLLIPPVKEGKKECILDPNPIGTNGGTQCFATRDCK